jgi:molybdate transport system ATP-binding protein
MLEIDCNARHGEFDLAVDVRLPTPGVSALFGVSGAGKSTLIAALAGLLRPTRGRIALDGEPLFDSERGLDLPAERRAIGCVFQDARLFPHRDVRGNLEYGLRRARQRRLLDFGRVVELLGLGALLTRRPHQLSGGEKQRVALGRALLSQPRLMLLDEPLASLDAARREELLPYFERLRDELAVPIVHVTHLFDEVIRLAQQVVVLERGRVRLCAPLATACASPALHAITGPDVTGAVLEGTVVRRDIAEGLALVRCARLELRIAASPNVRAGLEPGARVRLFIAADDVAVARERPQSISMRNVLPAQIEQIEPAGSGVLLHLAVAGERLLARITHSALRELGLDPGTECFALFKAVATHGRRFERVEAVA